ncbi:hypothetical protein ACOME3_000048 [Neoechinorhynchus agilis]
MSSSPSGLKERKCVTTFGKKKTATATVKVCECRNKSGTILVNSRPISLVQPECLRLKLEEATMLIRPSKLRELNIRVHVRGGGHVSQIYAIRQAIAKGIVAYYQKYVDEQSKNELRNALLSYDRSLLVADPRRCEPKKFGGPGARAKYQKSYR